MGVMRLLKSSAASPDEAEGVPIGLLLLVLYLLTLLYAENNRHTEVAADGTASILGRNPRFCLSQDTDSFFVENVVRSTQHFEIAEMPVLLHDKADYNTSFYPFRHGRIRVVYLGCKMPIKRIYIFAISRFHLYILIFMYSSVFGDS